MPVPEPTEVPAELLAAKDAIKDQLMALPGVTGVGVGFEEVGGEPTGRLAIRVFVESKFDVPDDQAIPTDVFGFPTDVVEAVWELEQLPDVTRHDPLVGGISGGPCDLFHGGTLGGVVRANASGRFMMVSNAHVLGSEPPDETVPPRRALQPERDPGHCPADEIGGIVRSSQADPTAAFTVDAAAILVDGPRPTHPDIVEVGTVRGTAVPAPGLPVRKRGRTTGLTFGHIFDVEVDLESDPGGHQLNRQFTVQVDGNLSTRWSASGDSGSFVVTADDRVVGLHWGAGGGLGGANPIHHVERVLDVAVAFKPIVTGMTPLATWAGPFAGGVTLTGRGFQGGNLLLAVGSPQVFFGGQSATILSATDDQIVVTPPIQLLPTTVDVVVHFRWEQSDPVQFTYEAMPVIASVSPAQGSNGGGDSVTIFGAGLSGLHRVTFGDRDAEVVSVTDTQIQVVSPSIFSIFGSPPVDVAVWKTSGRSAAWFGAQYRYL